MPQKGCVHNLLPKPALGYLQLVTKNTSALISGICKTSYHFDRREMLKTVIILSKVTSPELTRFNELVTACSFIDDRKLQRKIYSSQQFLKISFILKPMLKMLAHLTLPLFLLCTYEFRQNLETVFSVICPYVKLTGYLKLVKFPGPQETQHHPTFCSAPIYSAARII